MNEGWNSKHDQRSVFVGARIWSTEGFALMLHSIVLAILGVVLIGVLSEILETVALKNHPWLARFFSAVLVGVMAYEHWGYHVWWVVLVIVGFAFALLHVLRHILHASEKK